MNEFVEQLLEVLRRNVEVDGLGVDLASTDTFDRHGLMTSHDGIVVFLEDGREFQVTVVESGGVW